MLEIKNLSLWYENNKRVLDNIYLEISDGECILLTGESGSGKSSFINSINGLAIAYENVESTGSIKVNGKEIKDLELYEVSRMIASVFQNPKTHFFNVNTTLELLFYLENIGLTREEMNLRMEEMLGIFHIEHLLERSIFELSGGEKQILSVASCYISGCKIIVLDEPSSNLDNSHIEVLTKMLKILKEKKITLIVAEHRIYYLMDIVDRIVLLNNGSIQQIYNQQDFWKLDIDQLHNLGLRDKLKTPLLVKKIDNQGNFEIRKLNFDFLVTHKFLKIKNLKLLTGKIYGIIGINGVGKSTFIKCLIGLMKKMDDEIFLNEKKLLKKDRINLSAIVMQDVNHQLFSSSVIDEVRLGVKYNDNNEINNILKKLDLYNLKDRHPFSLSGGEKQRLAIACVLNQKSKFVFFDEPTSGMDYTNMLKISNIINDYRSDDKIIFIVSHDNEFLNLTADYIIDMNEHIN